LKVMNVTASCYRNKFSLIKYYLHTFEQVGNK